MSFIYIHRLIHIIHIVIHILSDILRYKKTIMRKAFFQMPFADGFVLHNNYTALPGSHKFSYAPTNCNYASAAVMIAIEYTSEALHPRERSLIGAFKPSKIGPYASKLPRRCAIL